MMIFEDDEAEDDEEQCRPKKKKTARQSNDDSKEDVSEEESLVHEEGANEEFLEGILWRAVIECLKQKTIGNGFDPLGRRLGDHVVYGWNFISDQQKGLLPALKEVMPRAHHRFCVQHVWKNFMKQWRDKQLRALLWECARCTTIPKFERTMQKLKALNEAALRCGTPRFLGHYAKTCKGPAAPRNKQKSAPMNISIETNMHGEIPLSQGGPAPEVDSQPTRGSSPQPSIPTESSHLPSEETMRAASSGTRARFMSTPGFRAPRRAP
ncbi:hypothetical protein K1719_012113 [Acacia pycnantha]|nr:hypothetical protein K1719_012113 [Acacia pycnantha]